MAATQASIRNSTDLYSLLVRENPELAPAEKETHIQFSAEDNQAHIETEIACHIRRLLQHPHFTLVDYRTIKTNSELQIVRVNGLLPIGCISVTYNPSEGQQSRQHRLRECTEKQCSQLYRSQLHPLFRRR